MSLIITADTTMGEILQAYPAAKVGLFQRYHIGGCSACSYQPTDTVAEVCATHKITDSIEQIAACIRGSDAVEMELHIRPTQVAAGLRSGEGWRVLDARTPEEFARRRLPSAQLITHALTFEVLDSWPKHTPIVIVSNRGQRSLERASYFRAYGMTNVRSMDGGLEAWSDKLGRLDGGC
jgi:rhodanese-related sulfurtransferase